MGEYCSSLVYISGKRGARESNDDGTFWMEGPFGEETRSSFHGQDLYCKVLSRLLDQTVFLWNPETISVLVHAAMKVFLRGCLDCPESSTNLIAITRQKLEPFSKVYSSLCILLMFTFYRVLIWRSQNGLHSSDTYFHFSKYYH